MYWRRWVASRSGCHVLIALHSTRKHTLMFNAFIDGQGKSSRWLRVSTLPLISTNITHLTMHLPPKPSLPTHTKSYPIHSFQNLNSQGRNNPSIPNQVRCTCHLWLQTSPDAIDCILFHSSLLWPNGVSLNTFWFDWFPIKGLIRTV